MTIIEAIREICDETIPKEIDGLTIHVVEHEIARRGLHVEDNEGRFEL